MPTKSKTNNRKTLTIDGEAIEVRFKLMTSIRVHIEPPDGRLWASAPVGTPLEEVEAMIRRRRESIRRKQEDVRARAESAGRDNLENGQVCILGGMYSIDARPAESGTPRLEGERVIVPGLDGHDQAALIADIDRFRLGLLRAELARLMPIWEERLGVSASWWGIRRMKSRWGSCSINSRRIRFSANLALRDLASIEYLVLHELAHLLVPNHGPDFVAIMDRHMPDWRARRRKMVGDDPTQTDVD